MIHVFYSLNHKLISDHPENVSFTFVSGGHLKLKVSSANPIVLNISSTNTLL